MTQVAKVSAIIVNRNGAEHLRICLPSLREQSYNDLEIIVVDNSSMDDSAIVAKSFGAKWISLRNNVGLAPALNRGAREARGDFLLFVNNDMRFHEDFVSSLVRTLMDDPTTFAVDGMQYDWDGTAPGHLATAVSHVRRRERWCIELVPGLFLRQQEEQQPKAVVMASAASMLVRRSFFESLGEFDERLPLSYEDVDLCWRAWVCGWKTVFVPDAICWHRVGSSCRSAEGSKLLFTGVLKGRLAFATKLLPLKYAALTWAASVAGLARDVAKLQWRFAWNRTKVLAEFVVRVPEFLRAKRELYQANGTTPAAHLDRMLQLDCERSAKTTCSHQAEKVAS